MHFCSLQYLLFFALVFVAYWLLPWNRVRVWLLCYFKYVNFFLESLQATLAAAGLSAQFRLLDVILPIGISFYTFEAINYTIDVYRRRIRAERDLSHFMLFILFFPHLITGPIVRAADF